MKRVKARGMSFINWSIVRQNLKAIDPYLFSGYATTMCWSLKAKKKSYWNKSELKKKTIDKKCEAFLNILP